MFVHQASAVILNTERQSRRETVEFKQEFQQI